MAPKIIVTLILLLASSVIIGGLAQIQATSPADARTIWLAPLPYTPWTAPSGQVFWNGSVDYFQLFTNEGAWSNARASVRIFKFYDWWIGNPMFVNDSTISLMISKLNAWGIKIAFESGALIPASTCGAGVEGFADRSVVASNLNRIKRLGGSVSYIALDEPYFYGSLYTGANACRYDVSTVASEVVSYIGLVESIFPGVIVGDIEPMLGNAVSVAQAKGWIETFRTISGHDFPFFDVDVQFSVEDWPLQIGPLEQYTRSRAIRIGIIYIGDFNDSTDEQWTGKVENRITAYEAVSRLQPDHVIFQSWMDKPDHALPESSSYTLTHLIKDYLRQRTYLTLQTPSLTSGTPASLTGHIIAITRLPITSASLALSMRPRDGAGFYANYKINGTIPGTAASAVVGFRVNLECGCAGTSNFNLYNVSLTQGSSSKNLISNYDFSSGLTGWGLWGNGTASVQTSDIGSGNMLQVAASPSTYLGINSASATVSSGLNYTLRFGAKVSPSTLSSGHFAIIFLNSSNQEISRETLTIETATVLIENTSTDGSGSYTQSWTPPRNGKFALSVSYPGSGLYWPSYCEVQVSVPSSATSHDCTLATISIHTRGSGSITISGTQYTSGENATYTIGDYSVTANPTSGYELTGWNSTGGLNIANPSTNPTTITLIGNAVMTATFTPPAETISAILPLLGGLSATIAIILRKQKRTSTSN